VIAARSLPVKLVRCFPSVYVIPESVTSQHHIAQALDSTAVKKIPTEPKGAAQIFLFHRKTNILQSVLTLKSRIQVIDTLLIII